jgi:hypothetical protein
MVRGRCWSYCPRRKRTPLALQLEGTGHRLALAVGCGLPSPGSQLSHGAHRGFNLQVALAVQGQGVGTFIAQRHRGGLGPGLQLDVVLQLVAGILIQYHRRAGVQPVVAHPAETRHVGGPVPRVVAEVVVAPARHCFLTLGPATGLGAFEVQGVGVAAGGAGCGGLLVPRPGVGMQQTIGEARLFQKQGAAGQGRGKTHWSGPLPPVFVEGQRGVGRHGGRRSPNRRSQQQ